MKIRDGSLDAVGRGLAVNSTYLTYLTYVRAYEMHYLHQCSQKKKIYNSIMKMNKPNECFEIGTCEICRDSP